MDVEPAVDSLAHGFASVLRAYVALRGGDTRGALARLDEGSEVIVSPRGGVGSAFYARTFERWLRAETLQALGRHDEALGWYRSVAEFSSHGVPYMAPAALREAEHAERAGDEALAAEYYRRFLAMRGGAEPALQPVTRDARRRLTELVGERPSP